MRKILLAASVLVAVVAAPAIVQAAIDNEVSISGNDEFAGFDSYSKSFVVSQTGYANTKVITVPSGQIWEVQTARATNCSSQPQRVSFKVADQDGITFISMPEGVTPVMVAPGATLSWTGALVLPEGWSVYAEWHDLDASGCKNNAQVTSLVLNGGVGSGPGGGNK